METGLTYAETVRVRLLALIMLNEHTPNSLSTAMGRAHSYLGRKLQAGEADAKRGLKTVDVDEVLSALRLGPEAVMAPVFGEVDLQLLRWLRENDGATRTDAAHLYRGVAKAVERLAMQAMVTEGEAGDLHLTPEGARWAA